MGKVTDESSRPVSNAAVLIAGSERGTVSNLSGEFEIADAPLNGTLVIKHPDFEAKQVTILKSVTEYVINLKARPQLARLKSQYKVLKKDAEWSQSGESSSAMRPDRWPYFPGGYKALNKFLANNLKYPQEALETGVEGAVQVSFLLDEDGNVSSGRILKSPGAELDDEALRLISLMPRWTPAQKEGKPIAVWYTISIHFDPEIDQLPLKIKEEVPKLFGIKIKLEPLKAPFLVRDAFKKLFQQSDLATRQSPLRQPPLRQSPMKEFQPSNFRTSGYSFLKQPEPLQLKFKPTP
ncbi:hypothetical protein GCM10010967_54800 [Dyadobacter beijingensis]|uniref:TonB C-terminal domain-containing protein n=2 Tax=Dyadobacter beijingensis TaxID=365489 RepID=A0ABQ2ILF1_9BACT|nr:hypothetical protein GCM10010967_54800 [Dyadobacter beijingensis]